MKFPCEIIVWKVLPKIKKEMAIQMKERGISQKEIAKKLHVTEAAISQYLSGKRANEFKLKGVDKEIKEAVSKILEHSELYVCSVCDICKKIRNLGLICDECKNVNSVDECSMCKEE